jgi:penicillin-binding protein 1A
MRHAFEHACRRCAGVFSPALELSQFTVLTAACPHCGYAHGYDNRDGKILSLLREKQGRSDEPLPPAAAEPPPLPAAPAQPEEPVSENFDTAETAYTSTIETTAIDRTEYPLQGEVRASGRVSAWQPKLPGIRQTVLVASTLLTLFVTGLVVMQAIPVADEEANAQLAQLKNREADVVLDRNGHELNRLGVSDSTKAVLADYPRWQIDTLLFAEDKNFFRHHGVEYSAILRAVLNNTLRLRYAQGASTITQQLARIMLQNRQKRILRKLSEIRLARALEATLSKPKILELYMNHVYLGHGNYSFASAARFYYDKTPQELSFNEFLSIVALIPSPERYSPLRNGRRLAGRMQALYERMRSAGMKVPDAQVYEGGMASVTAQAERFSTETAFGSKVAPCALASPVCTRFSHPAQDSCR